MRRAKRITALAVAAAMVFSNVAYAAPGTDTTTTQAGAESAESLNSQSDASGGIEGQASDQTGNGTDSSAQAEQQTETKKTDTQNTTTDAGSQTEAQTTQEETAKEETTKDETSSQTPSTDTQTQETPSTDEEAQKAEEKQEASKTEEEKVLYDITFETPEKHGKVTDMDGNEVADGKTLKTDENGKVQFKVKADDGYQVSAVYQMPDEKAPLKLVEDSYYELQVDKNTTVKVVYQKIPEKSEDGEDAGSDKAEEPKEDAGAKTEDQQTTGEAEASEKKEANGTVSMKAMLAANPNAEVNVQIVDEEGSIILESYLMTVGRISEQAPDLSDLDVEEPYKDYVFEKAVIDQTEITYVAQDSKGDFYYSTSDDNVTGIALGQDTIKLVYAEKVVNHTITYKVFVDNAEVSDYSEMVDIQGVTEVVDGQNLEFLVSAEKGYELESVKVSGAYRPLSPDGNKYTVENVNRNLTIEVSINKIKNYDIKFSGSNTLFKYGRETFYSNSGGTSDYTSGDQRLTFSIEPWGQYPGTLRILNKIAISMGNEVVNAGIVLPGENGNSSDTATTTLSNGIEVTVTRGERVTNSGGEYNAQGYKYTVTISASTGLYDDIDCF